MPRTCAKKGCGKNPSGGITGNMCLQHLEEVCEAVADTKKQGIREWYQINGVKHRGRNTQSVAGRSREVWVVPRVVIEHALSEEAAKHVVGEGRKRASQLAAGRNARAKGKADAPAPLIEYLPIPIKRDANSNALCFKCNKNIAYFCLPLHLCVLCGVALYGEDPYAETGIIPLAKQGEDGKIVLGMAIPVRSFGKETYSISVEDTAQFFSHTVLKKTEHSALLERLQERMRKQKANIKARAALKSTMCALRTGVQPRASPALLDAQTPIIEKTIADTTPAEGEPRNTFIYVGAGRAAATGDLLDNNEAFGHLFAVNRTLPFLIPESDGTGSAIKISDLKTGFLAGTWTCTPLGREDGEPTSRQEALDIELNTQGKFSGREVPGRLWLKDGAGERIGRRAGHHRCVIMTYGFGDLVRAGRLVCNSAMRPAMKNDFITNFGFDEEKHFVPPSYGKKQSYSDALFEKLLEARMVEIERQEQAEYDAALAADADATKSGKKRTWTQEEHEAKDKELDRCMKKWEKERFAKDE